ncbi:MULTISPECIES: lipase family protein [Rhodococcus]|uniref:Lipase family protein n=1 Tax=Rhodococcus cerastii TaxID=908616 RepID=A0ABU4D3Z9_9NOCA|nr:MULTISPECIES: lipase family protein [Rhodococcus]MDV6304422.1 lipase family protein [Rhodococcus cerastii]MDV7991242.1 lipase family protein [Rhodococcus sp. IEGM 1374]MDV8077539.1 lipase family protein [Rhodococcus sp. IEGM 1370]
MNSSTRSAKRPLLSTVLAVALSVTACSSGSSPQVNLDGAVPTPPAGDDRGAIVSSEVFETDYQPLAGAALRKVLYKSTSGIDGTEKTVSAVVVVPSSAPPQGGWPVVVYGHGTTGIKPECGPSNDPTLMGGAAAAAVLASKGYITVLPDYQGLGTVQAGDIHPYLEPNTAGHNMIDAARAARYLVPNTSTRWVAYGASQGGQAAWAANELSSTYGTGLDLVGAVALSPITDATGLVDAAVAGTLTGAQKLVMPMLLETLAESDPTIELGDYIHGEALAKKDLLTTCLNVNPEAIDAVGRQIYALDFAPSTPESETALRTVLTERALPKTPTQAPMLVIYGDEDDTVLPAWTTASVAEACAKGDIIESILQPGKGHAVDPTPSVDFLAERFAGASPTNSC